MPDKIKILMSLNSLGLGGNEIFVINFLRRIDNEKFQVDVLIYDDTKLDFYNEVKSFGSKVFIIKGTDYRSRKKQIKTIINNEKYNIIHINSCSLKGLLKTVIPVSAIKNTNIKIVAHAHNPGTPRNTIIDNISRNILKAFLTSKIDYGFACSEESGESKFTSKLLKSKRFFVINNAIESERFSYKPDVRKQLREQLDIEDKFVIGNVGRVEKQKNYLFFLDVLKKYVAIAPQTVFLLVGAGSQIAEMKKETKDYNLEKNVIFVEKAEDAERYYQAMDLFVLPSIYEGFGFVNIEAQVSGLSCVVSDIVPKTVDISNAVSFVPLDVDLWVKALEEKCDISSERKTCVTSKYELKCETRRLEQIYYGLINTENR